MTIEMCKYKEVVQVIQNLKYCKIWIFTAAIENEMQQILGLLHIDCHVGNKTTIWAQKIFNFFRDVTLPHAVGPAAHEVRGAIVSHDARQMLHNPLPL